MLRYKYDLTSEKERYNSLSYGGATSQRSKETASECKLNKILRKCNPDYKRQYIYKTSYNNFLTIDFYENLGNLEIFYEITDAKSTTALRSLAGKLVFLKNVDPSLKLMVILTKISRKMDTRDEKVISKYADVVLLKKEFNEKDFLLARSKWVNSTSNEVGG